MIGLVQLLIVLMVKLLQVAVTKSAVKLWDSRTGECLRILRGHTNKAREISFSSNGNISASCSDDNTIKLWEVSSGECVKTLRTYREYMDSSNSS